MRLRSTAAARHRYGFIAILDYFSATRRIPLIGLKIHDIKRLATGNAKATKQEMTKAANDNWNVKLDVENCEKNGDDDKADALWIAQLGLETFGYDK
jgi:Holliday junction resolvasome RuvABC endonuclease subunit